MVFKINISGKNGKTWKFETESEVLIGKKLGEKLNGSEISPDLAGYELTINGASDIAGFPHKLDVEGPQLKRVLLSKGWGMHKRPKKEGKRKVQTPRGFRKRKTVRGNIISEKTTQINLMITREGSKKISEIFPEQNKIIEIEKPTEVIKEAPKEEIKDSIPESPETETSESKENAAEEIAEKEKKEQ